MKKMMQIAALILTTLVALAPSALGAVRVYVTPVAGAGATTYRYRVVNDSTQRIVSLQIGYDYPHGVYTLDVPPLGWSRESGLPSSSVTSPGGWSAELMTTEETESQNVLAWSSDGAASDILPGASKSGFSVKVAAPAGAYANGLWTAIFGDSSDTSADLAASGTLQIDQNPPPDTDNTPPAISVTLSPATIWPPSHKMVKVTAQVQVSDDRDPNPVVRLVSITANEGNPDDVSGADLGTYDREFSVRAERTGQQKQGRVYTVRYSATDASGNTAFANATVTVPHDQRK